MDDELRELERAQAADPEDAVTAERLKAALLRAGRRDEVRQRYQLGFVCETRWDQMQLGPGVDGDVRHCGSCRRDVHLARSYADFDRLAAQGHCVAAYASALPQVLDGLVDAAGRPFSRGQGPCLVDRGVELPRPPMPHPMPLAGGPMPMRRPTHPPPQPFDPRQPQPPPPPPPPKPTGLLGWLRGLVGG